MELSNGDHLVADALMFAVGRSPNITALGLDEVRVATGPNDGVTVDAENRTSVASIFAVGDVTDRIQLTPVAIREGHPLADRFFNNRPADIDYTAVPSAVFSDPPLASVGLRSEEHTSELQSLLRISYPVLCLQTQTTIQEQPKPTTQSKIRP